jgi:phage-related protein
MGKSLPRLLEVARAAAKATGQDVGFLFESLVSGIKRSSPMLIDNTGLVLKMGEANEAMAASLGKAVTELTAEEKQIALLNATTAAGQKMIDEFGGGAVTAAEQIAQFKAQIQNTKDEVGIAFLPALQALLTPIQDIATDAGPKLIEWAQVAGEWLGENLPRLIGVLKDLLAGDFEDALYGIATVISNTFGRDAAAGFLNFAGKVKEGIDKAREVLQKIVSWIQQNWPKVRKVILPIVEKIQKWFIENWPKIQEAVLGAVEKIRAWFVQNWPIIQGVVLTAWEVIKGVVGAAIDVIVPAVQEFVATIGEHLQAFVPLFDKLKALWESLQPVIGAVLAAVGAIVLAAVGIIVGLFKGVMAALGPIIEGIAGVIGGIITAVTGVIDFLVGAVKLIISLFTGSSEDAQKAWGEMKQGIIDIVTGLWTSVIELIGGLALGITELVSGIVTGVVEFFQGLYDDLVGNSIISDLMTDMLQGFTDGFNDIITRIKEKIQEIIDKIKDRVQDFIDTGKALIEGLSKGIREAVKDLLRKIGGWIQDIIDEAKKRAGIDSPSSVFAEIGREMSEGLAVGIAGSAQIPAMAASGLVASTVSSTEYNFSMSVTPATFGTGDVIMGYETMKALAGA